MASNLHHVLTPSLFTFIVDCMISFPKSQVNCAFLLNDPFDEKFRERVWPALVALSKVGLETMPNMLDFLPPPSSDDFPAQCLGLQILLDQAPRVLCRTESVDSRWVNSYFDQISYKLARTWLALPAEQRPDSWELWKKQSASLDYWLRVRRLFSCPQVHYGTPESQELAIAFNDETRRVVEGICGQTDPNRAERQEILSDLYGFPRMLSEGLPGDLTTITWCWWTLKLSDIHKPIIDKFGRYPYRNLVQGLDSTEEEKEWIEKTNHFGEAPADVGKRVKEDIAAGRWTPLGST
ncbi:hypothetical protein BX600DRAFT_457312 [Xylariales sp. PMI_506]|nr:hypothetical protein BX600DRAFT_457312 [Xylariales sp. PMI_506]